MEFNKRNVPICKAQRGQILDANRITGSRKYLMEYIGKSPFHVLNTYSCCDYRLSGSQN